MNRIKCLKFSSRFHRKQLFSGCLSCTIQQYFNFSLYNVCLANSFIICYTVSQGHNEGCSADDDINPSLCQLPGFCLDVSYFEMTIFTYN